MEVSRVFPILGSHVTLPGPAEQHVKAGLIQNVKVLSGGNPVYIHFQSSGQANCRSGTVRRIPYVQPFVDVHNELKSFGELLVHQVNR